MFISSGVVSRDIRVKEIIQEEDRVDQTRWCHEVWRCLLRGYKESRGHERPFQHLDL